MQGDTFQCMRSGSPGPLAARCLREGCCPPTLHLSPSDTPGVVACGRPSLGLTGERGRPCALRPIKEEGEGGAGPSGRDTNPNKSLAK